jgi:hypothetical protein
MAVLREKFIAMSEYINNTERPQINDLMVEKCEKMLILLCHKGNENENHIVILPHSIRIVTIKDTNNLKW